MTQSSFKTLVIYSKLTGEILLVWTPDITPGGQELSEKDLPDWFDPENHGVLHDARRPELHGYHPTKKDENGNPLPMVETLRARRIKSTEPGLMRVMSTGIFNNPPVELVDIDTPRANPDDPLS